MERRHRYERVKAIVRKLNVKRRRQAKQIDILCKDLIEAQRQFIARLEQISERADFYEQLLGCQGLEAVLLAGANNIRQKLGDVCVGYYLPGSGNHFSRFFANEQLSHDQRLESFFSDELINSICRMNKICRLEEFCQLGLQCSPALLNKISAATIPLGGGPASIGFILVYTMSGNLSSKQLNSLQTRMLGLSEAIVACQNLAAVQAPADN